MDANVFGKFHVLARLAAGGISDVFKAKTTGVAGFEKVQVLKRIHSELSGDQRFISAFARETQVAVSLNHRNIVQVYEFGRVGPDYFLAMEFVDGVDLGRILEMRDRGRGPIPQGIALHIASEVAAGLDYAHSKSDYGGGSLGVVHADLAPNHVLASFEGSVKILDFGIARAARDRGAENVGRPGYTSPEQARGGLTEPRSDIYCLGILLYEMILGSTPFPGKNEAEMMEANRKGSFVPPREIQPDIDPQILEILNRCLSLEIEGRFAHARDFVRAALGIQRTAGEFHNTRTLRDFLNEYVGERGERIPEDLRPASDVSAPGEAPSDVELAGRDMDAFEIDTFVPEPESPPSSQLSDDFESETSRQRPLKGAPLRGAPMTPEVEALALAPEPSAPLEPRRSKPLGPSVRKPVVVVHLEPSGMESLGPLFETTGATETEVRRDLRTLIEGMAYRAGGVTPKVSNSNGFTVTFGLPVSSENDHEVAVRLALDAVEAANGMGRDLLARAGLAAGPSPLNLRAGIKAGTARLREGGDQIVYSVLGDAAEVAAALAMTSPPGGVLATGATVQRTRDGFLYREGPMVRGRGGKGNRGHVVVGTRSHAERRRALSSGGHPMVGRDEELAGIVSAHEKAAEGSRVSGLVITGAAGIGKSRLLIEFAEHLGSDAVVLQGACRFYSAGTPYSLWVDIVRDHLGIAEYDDPLRVRQRLDDWLEKVFDDPASADLARSALLEMLALRKRGDLDLDGDTEERKHASFRAVELLLDRVGGDRLLVLLIEDAQWIDATSADLLARVVERRQSPLFLVCTARAGDLPAQMAEFPSIELGSLDLDSQRRLLARRLGKRAGRGDIIEEIIRKAGGNPFFLIELAEAVREAESAAKMDIPVTVRGAVTARVDRLSTTAGRVLRAAAVIGRNAPRSLLEAVVAAQEDQQAELESAMAEICAKGLVVEEASEHGESHYVFRQSIVQEIVYDSLEGPRCKALHREVAERLEQLGKEDAASSAELARHLESAGELERAGLAYLRAAQAASAAYANAEALAFYDRAYRHLASDPDKELEILAGRERVHVVTGATEQQKRDLDRMERIARARRDHGWLTETLVRRSEHLRLRGRYDEARRAAMEAVETAARTADGSHEGRAEKEMGELYAYGGDIEGALDRYRRALRFFERDGSPLHIWRTHSAIGGALLMASRHAEADEHFKKAYALTEEAGDDWGAATALQARAAIAYINSDFDVCLERSERALEISRQIGNRRAEATNTNNIGLTYAELGTWDVAADWLHRAKEIYDELSDKVYIVDTTIGLGWVERRLGNRAKARRYLQRALDISTQLGHVYWLLNAKLALARHELEGNAATDWRRALRFAEQAVELGRESSLIHGVIQGESRAGAALLKLDRLDEAKEHSARAMESLREQKIVECSEEEVYFTHYQVLAAAEDATASEYLDQALAGIQSKSDRIRDAERRKTFLAIPLHREVIELARKR